MFTKTGQGARDHGSLGHAVKTPHCRSHRLDKRPSLTKGFSSKIQSQNAPKHTARHALGRGAAKWNPSWTMNNNNQGFLNFCLKMFVQCFTHQHAKRFWTSMSSALTRQQNILLWLRPPNCTAKPTDPMFHNVVITLD